MKLSFEFLGITLAWLLSWAGKAAIAEDILHSKSLDNCIMKNDSAVIDFAAVEYDTNPQCPQSKAIGNLLFDRGPGTTVENWAKGWADMFWQASPDFYNNPMSAAILSHCRPISSPKYNSCPFDLEKDTLITATEEAIHRFVAILPIARRYIKALQTFSDSITNEEVAALYATATNGLLDKRGDLTGIYFFCDIMRSVAMFYTTWEPAGGLTKSGIKSAVEIGKRIIDNPDPTEETFCAERQFRHFLYRILRSQLKILSFLNLPKTPLGKYYKFEVNNHWKGKLEALVNLNIPNIVKSMPVDAAVNKIYNTFNDAYVLDWQWDWRSKVGLLVQRSYMFSEAGMGPKGAPSIPLSEVKDWVKDLDITTEQIEYILHVLGTLKHKLTNPSAVSANSSTSIHECVEYLGRASSSTGPSELRSNELISFHGLHNLLWDSFMMTPDKLS
ncbi:hypothetical protein NEHOM01_0571 [Nematocida homosporus]|uniref:uncharacterized protein n=1 Tax=Nematocida homosporus TaxID=1912981 RepID=UPI0022205648|nr:uncharacterized protein NEHOM01_0571 [Nematocida homosporus]KAI5185066.1 hypothetical protein NEHOM01_0571 [Nematocida homosporus]